MSDCKSNQKGLFVEVRYFQLLQVDVHEDVKSRYLRQVMETAEKERALFELDEKVPHVTPHLSSLTSSNE